MAVGKKDQNLRFQTSLALFISNVTTKTKFGSLAFFYFGELVLFDHLPCLQKIATNNTKTVNLVQFCGQLGQFTAEM